MPRNKFEAIINLQHSTALHVFITIGLDIHYALIIDSFGLGTGRSIRC